MNKAFIAALLFCGTAFAAQRFEDGSVLLTEAEASYVVGVVNNMNEKVVLQDIRIKELEAELKSLKTAKCL